MQGAHACVPYETELVVWENGQRKLTQMGALVEAFEAHPQRRYEVLSLNLQTLQLERKPVCRAYKFANTQPVYRAETESGKAFVATADHIVYRLALGGTCEEVPLARVRPGDFVAIAKTTDKEDHHAGEISINRPSYRLRLYAGYRALFAQQIGFLVSHKTTTLRRMSRRQQPSW